MVTELVGHHVVNSRSAKLGPIHSPPTHTLSTLPRALSVVTGIIFAAGRGDFVSLTPLAHAHAR